MSRLRSLIIFLFVLFLGYPISAKETECIVSQSLADSLAKEQVIYRNRIAPFHTVALDITRKLTGGTGYNNLDAVRFAMSLSMYPDYWKEVPYIKVENKALLDSLGIEHGDKVAPSLLFGDKGDLILNELWTEGNGHTNDAVLSLYGKVTIIEMLQTNSLYTPLSVTRHRPLPSWRIGLEIFYNNANFSGWCFIMTFIVAFAGTVLCFIKKYKVNLFLYLLVSLVGILSFALRWIIGRHIPLEGGEQVMMFTYMILSLIASSLTLKDPWIANGCMYMGGFTALVARLSVKEYIITTLSPALSSPWLAFHVSVIMISYALLAVLLPISIYLIYTKNKITEIERTSLVLNLSGVIMLGAGIILGALWAKEAWGSYWSWDPKENWAAITFFAYLIPLVLYKSIKSKPQVYGWLLIISFSAMVITYFGVNFMSSLHSYGT